MIAIDKALVSDEVVQEQFVCDLSACKGGCCEDGDAGAPLTAAELDEVINAYEKVKPYLSAAGLAEIKKVGLYQYDRSFGWVTPTIDGKMCVYGIKDANGHITCSFEKLHREGAISWKKPISCHLYPIKIKSTKDYDLVNYEPRSEGLCKSGCSLGKQLKVPVYTFLKEALIRQYGEEFYEALDAVAKQYFSTQQGK